MEEVDPTGAALVLLVEAVGVAVALAEDRPVARTDVPVVATPPTRPLVVLLAYGAFADVVAAVALKPLAVMLAFESDRPVDKPVAKIELEVVVMLAELAVALVSVALNCHVEGD